MSEVHPKELSNFWGLLITLKAAKEGTAVRPLAGGGGAALRAQSLSKMNAVHAFDKCLARPVPL